MSELRLTPEPLTDDVRGLLDALPGWAEAAAAAGLGTLLLGGLLMRAVLRSMPEAPTLEDLDDVELGAERLAVVDAFERLGFVRLGPARLVGVLPPGIVVPMLHPERSVFGTVFHVDTGPHAATAWECVSMLRHELSGLTTGSDVRGGTAPAWSGSFRQLLPGLPPAQLLARHDDALAYLAENGLPPRPVRGDEFESLFRLSFRLQRRTFVRAPVRNLVRSVWRAVTQTNPHVGPLRAQAIARAQIAALRNGAWPEAGLRDAVGA